mgnify:CR=1 FL=1
MTKRNILTTILISIFTLATAVVVAQPVLAAECGGAQTAIIDCGNKTGEDAIFAIIKQVIQILNYGIGILAIGGVVVGGIMYSTSGSSPEGLKRARTVWINVGIGLALYATLVALTNFLIPGGVF